MSGELEAAGAAATAGLAAAAIEGRGPHGGGHDGACANCGASLQGAYCHACGQSAHNHRSLVHMIEEFVHGILHFDTKAWRTLPLLVGRPGTLTRNYVYGKRARYISPLALFLFTIFFMFFVFAFMPAPVNVNGPTPDAEVSAEAITRLAAERDAARAEMQEIERSGASDASSNINREVARRRLQVAESAIAQLESGEGATVGPNGDVVVGVEDDYTWRDSMREAAKRDDFIVVDGWDSFNERIRKKFENPDLALYKIQQTAYKFSFLLVPISLPFIALLFLWKRGVTLYDHTVFALYSLSFAALLFVFMTLIDAIPHVGWVGETALGFGLPLHTYFHLKGAYALGWFSGLWRTVLMLIFAVMSLIIFLISIVVVGLTG